MKPLQRLRYLLLKAAYPLTKSIGRFHLPFTKRRVGGVDVLNFLAMSLEKDPIGMVLLTRTRGEPTNLMIPGFWKHAAIYIGGGNVIEAVGAGVIKTDIITFLTSKDFVVGLEPRFKCKRDLAVTFAKEQEGLEYDYDFKGKNKAFYCAELVWAAYDDQFQDMAIPCPFTIRETLGEPTVSAQDFYMATDKWNLSWWTRSWWKYSEKFASPAWKAANEQARTQAQKDK